MSSKSGVRLGCICVACLFSSIANVSTANPDTEPPEVRACSESAPCARGPASVSIVCASTSAPHQAERAQAVSQGEIPGVFSPVVCVCVHLLACVAACAPRGVMSAWEQAQAETDSEAHGLKVVVAL